RVRVPSILNESMVSSRQSVRSSTWLPSPRRRSRITPWVGLPSWKRGELCTMRILLSIPWCDRARNSVTRPGSAGCGRRRRGADRPVGGGRRGGRSETLEVADRILGVPAETGVGVALALLVLAPGRSGEEALEGSQRVRIAERAQPGHCLAPLGAGGLLDEVVGEGLQPVDAIAEAELLGQGEGALAHRPVAARRPPDPPPACGGLLAPLGHA